MELREILSIAGKPGLYRMIKQTGNGMIVEGLSDKRRFPVFAHDQISSLEEISIFTNTEDLPLREVFQNIAAKYEGQAALNPKKASGKELKAFMNEVVPDYDEDQVYVSHMKKIVAWYNELQRNDLLSLLETSEEEAAEQENAEESEESKAE